MSPQEWKKTLMAIGASAHAIILQTEILIEQMDQALAQAAAMPETPAEPGACQHPVEARMPAGVMGKPNRFLCRACNKTINGDDK